MPNVARQDVVFAAHPAVQNRYVYFFIHLFIDLLIIFTRVAFSDGFRTCVEQGKDTAMTLALSYSALLAHVRVLMSTRPTPSFPSPSLSPPHKHTHSLKCARPPVHPPAPVLAFPHPPTHPPPSRLPILLTSETVSRLPGALMFPAQHYTDGAATDVRSIDARKARRSELIFFSLGGYLECTLL